MFAIQPPVLVVVLLKAGGVISTSPVFNNKTTKTGGCMANIEHYEDSPFLRTHEQTPEGIPV